MCTCSRIFRIATQKSMPPPVLVLESILFMSDASIAHPFVDCVLPRGHAIPWFPPAFLVMTCEIWNSKWTHATIVVAKWFPKTGVPLEISSFFLLQSNGYAAMSWRHVPRNMDCVLVLGAVVHATSIFAVYVGIFLNKLPYTTLTYGGWIQTTPMSTIQASVGL